jgi:multiple sugar transport system permease protein
MIATYLDKYAKHILTIPSLLIIIVLIVYPSIYLVRMCFSEYDLTYMPAPEFNGLENFKLLVKDQYFWSALFNTLIISITAVILEFVLGLSLSLLVESATKGANLFKSIFIISMMIPPIVIGLNFKLIYDQFGPLNSLAQAFGLGTIGWLSTPFMARISIVLVDVWQWTPFMFIIILAGLQAVNPEYYDAARVDGARGLQLFRFVTWPMILPAVTVAIAFRVIDSLKIFDIIFMVTWGGPSGATETLSLYIYRTAFRFGNLGYAATLAFVMLILLSVVITIFLKLIGLSKRMEWT